MGPSGWEHEVRPSIRQAASVWACFPRSRSIPGNQAQPRRFQHAEYLGEIDRHWVRTEPRPNHPRVDRQRCTDRRRAVAKDRTQSRSETDGSPVKLRCIHGSLRVRDPALESLAPPVPGLQVRPSQQARRHRTLELVHPEALPASPDPVAEVDAIAHAPWCLSSWQRSRRCILHCQNQADHGIAKRCSIVQTWAQSMNHSGRASETAQSNSLALAGSSLLKRERFHVRLPLRITPGYCTRRILR
jgi:hypothetical protein